MPAKPNLQTSLDRISSAQWVLERNLSWIAAAEVKVGVIVAIDTAMAGVLGGAITNSDSATKSLLALLLIGVCFITLIMAIYCAAMAVLPRVTGPDRSLIFFGKIAKKGHADYIAEFKNTDEKEFLEDLLAQIHRNAEIASVKFGYVRKAMQWTFGTFPFWFIAMAFLIKK